MSATDIMAVAKPLMSIRKSKKLSTYSDLIELMIKSTHVDVDGSKEELVEEWDEVEEEINTTVESFPVLQETLDPVFLILRGHQEGPAPPAAWIAAQILAIPVGRANGGLSQAANAANSEVSRVAAEPSIADIYQFANMGDARVARFALQAHATSSSSPLAGAAADP